MKQLSVIPGAAERQSEIQKCLASLDSSFSLRTAEMMTEWKSRSVQRSLLREKYASGAGIVIGGRAAGVRTGVPSDRAQRRQYRRYALTPCAWRRIEPGSSRTQLLFASYLADLALVALPTPLERLANRGDGKCRSAVLILSSSPEAAPCCRNMAI